MLKIGIIGFGKMGQTRAKAIESNGEGVIEAVYDIDQNMNYQGYDYYDDPYKIINHEKIDALFICTPNFKNKEFTIAGLNAGKHVFCEKPPAFTAADVEEIRASEAKSGKKLMYGFNHRHHGSIKQIKQHIDNNDFGKIIWMRGRYGKSVDQSYFDTWRSKKELAGGGILLDQGIHMLDLFLYLTGGFDDIKAFITNQYWKECDIEDNAFVIMRNSETGVTASLHSTMTQWRHLFSLEVFLERGYMVLNGIKTSSGTYGDEVLSIARNRTTAPAATWEDEERIVFHTDQSWRSEIDYFFSCILNNNAIEIGNSEEALTLMRTIDKIYEVGRV